jgi:CubicO group peptidase (beta-lactamase class C family)
MALSTAALSAQNIPRPPQALDEYIAQAVANWKVPGLAIAIVRGDSVFAAGYGVRALGKPALVDPHTIFDVASLTKSFTAAAAAILVDEGKLRWDDPVRRHVPSLHFPDSFLDREVTLRDVLSHRVGLNPSNWMFRFLGEEGDAATLARVRYLKPQIPLRTNLLYSNYGYVIAGEVIASAARVSWADFVRTRLLEPLGMRESFVNGDLPVDGNAARPHAWVGGREQEIRSGSGAQGGAAAGVRSSVLDMARWLRFQLSGGELDGQRLISARSMEEMRSPQVIIATTAAMRASRLVNFFGGYALGWQVMDYRGHPIVWHSGSGDGIAAYMAMLPNERTGVVVLINSWTGLTLHGAIVNRVMDHYLGAAPRDWAGEQLARNPAPGSGGMMQMQDRTKLARSPSAYAGDYADGLYGPIHIRSTPAGLTLQMNKGEIADLYPLAGDTLHVHWQDPFFAGMFATSIVFRVDAGRAVSLRMPLARDTVTAARTNR